MIKRPVDSADNLLFLSRRLEVRVFRPEDITATYLDALNANEIVGLTEARHQHWNIANATQYIENSNKLGESILFRVSLREVDKSIGNIRLFNFHEVHNRAELSFLFYDQEEWGKGYATEAIDTVVNYGFESLKLHRIHADYYELNSRSGRVFEKLGFEIEGIYRDHFFFDDMYIDSVRVGKIAK